MDNKQMNVVTIGSSPNMLRSSGIFPRLHVQRVAPNTYTIGGAKRGYKTVVAQYDTMCQTIKATMSILYPVSWYITLDVIDRVKKTKHWRFQLKKLLNEYISEMHRNKAMMLNPPKNVSTLFSMKNIVNVPLAFREGFTDEDYYDFWENQGLMAFHRIEDDVKALRWLFFKGMKRKGINDADILSWLMLAETLTAFIQCDMNEKIRMYSELYVIAESDISYCFLPFDISKALHKLSLACTSMCPNIARKMEGVIDEPEVRKKLHDILYALTDSENVLLIIRENILDNKDVFRSEEKMNDYLNQIDSQLEDCKKTRQTILDGISKGKTRNEIYNEVVNGKD